MNEIDKKIKKVNLIRLEKLSNEELVERIKQKEIRIKEKLQYYENLHQLNLARLAAYKKYRDEDAKACSEVLNKRKSTPVPSVEKKSVNEIQAKQ